MRLRNFLSWFASSIISFVLMFLVINLVTSALVDISMQNTLPLIIGSIYDFSTDHAHYQSRDSFDVICNNVKESITRKTSRTECDPANQQILLNNCDNIENLPIDQKQEYAKICDGIRDGSLTQSCNSDPKIELAELSKGCDKLSSATITTREFLVGPLSRVLVKSIEDTISQSEESSQAAQITKDENLNSDVLKYAVRYIQGLEEDYFAAKIITVILLFMLWYAVSHDLSDYIRSVSRMFFSTGMLVFAIWEISFLITVLFPPDTSALLLIISGQSSIVQPTFVQMLAILPIIVLQLTSSVVLLIAAASIICAFLLFLLRKYYVDVYYPHQTPEESKK